MTGCRASRRKGCDLTSGARCARARKGRAPSQPAPSCARIFLHVSSWSAFLASTRTMGIAAPRAWITPSERRFKSRYASPSQTRPAVSALVTLAASTADKRLNRPSRVNGSVRCSRVMDRSDSLPPDSLRRDAATLDETGCNFVSRGLCSRRAAGRAQGRATSRPVARPPTPKPFTTALLHSAPSEISPRVASMPDSERRNRQRKMERISAEGGRGVSPRRKCVASWGWQRIVPTGRTLGTILRGKPLTP
jgi:hypothetical protein